VLYVAVLQEDDGVLVYVNGNFSDKNMDKSKVFVHQIKMLHKLQVHATVYDLLVTLLSRNGFV
jgi:hypothetical protein